MALHQRRRTDDATLPRDRISERRPKLGGGQEASVITFTRSRLVWVLQGAAAGFAAVMLFTWAYFAFLTVGVSIDGRHLRLPASTTVGDLFGRKIVERRFGNLVSVKTHKVLSRGGGNRPSISDGSRVMGYDNLLVGAGELTSHNGTDIVEGTRVVTESIDPPTQYQGVGPVESTVKEGKPGTRELTKGVLSGQVIKKRELVAAMPRVVARRGLAPGDKTVALTFDDGPWPGSTKAIVSILKQQGVKATFFMIGRQARQMPDLARIVSGAGMDIGNHTEHHLLSFGKLNSATTYKEIADGQRDISRASGVTPRFFRPPGGFTSKAMGDAMKKLRMSWVLWSTDTEDWKRPSPGKITSRATKYVHPGYVILMHDGGGDRSNTVKALPGIIKKLKSMGYSFVTLEAIAKLPHYMG